MWYELQLKLNSMGIDVFVLNFTISISFTWMIIIIEIVLLTSGKLS